MTPLPPVPDTLIDTRLALHRLATYVIAPARYRSTERFGLRATDGGFGTPPFDDRRIRVEGLDIIDERNGDAQRSPISSLANAAEFLDVEIDAETAAEHDSPELGDTAVDLGIDADASAWLGQWFGAAFEALATVAADDVSVDASEPQLWPGHFDPAIEMGDENHRASYGASPGDDAIAEPYLYVSAWWPDRLGIERDETWDAEPFIGKQLRVSDFESGVDPVVQATRFWRETRDLLDAQPFTEA